MTEHDLLAVACEQFLGKSVIEIKTVVLQTLEGHLRSILGTCFKWKDENKAAACLWRR